MQAFKIVFRIVFIAVIICSLVTVRSYAQNMEARPLQAPAPGQTVTASGAASPTPGCAPPPGAPDGAGGAVRLTSVISLHDAQAWVDRFKNQTATPTSPVLDQLATFYEWLLELLDEHNRLAAVFAKGESTKSMADTERQTVAGFNHLKCEVLLLRAESLIKLNRYAESIVPLVDVVHAEPSTAAGKEAYKDLQDIGFSEIPDFRR